MHQLLSPVERRILDYMVQYLRDNTFQPSIREIGEEFGIRSTKTVSEHLRALADKGYLERDPSRSRGVRILGMDLHAETVSVPCYREIPDPDHGLRSDGVEMHLSLDRRVAGAKGSFFVRARGEGQGSSADIRENDLLLVEPADLDELREGDLVAVKVDESPTFARFARSGSIVMLHNGATAPLAVEDPSRLRVIGRVAALHRTMDGVSPVMSPVAH